MGIDEVTLADWLEFPEGKGFVYLVDGHAAVELDLFSDEYTVCWLSNLSMGEHRGPIIDLLGEVSSQRLDQSRELGYKIEEASTADLVLVSEVDGKHSLSAYQLKLYSVGSVYDQMSRVNDLLAAPIAGLDLTFAPAQIDIWAKFTFWTQTDRASEKYKETGLTTTFGSPLPVSVTHLMRSTSPLLRGLPDGEFGEILERVRAVTMR